MKQQTTRGFGLLEHFLSSRRSAKAISLINPLQLEGKALDAGCGRDSLFLREYKGTLRVALDKHFSREDAARLAKVKIQAVVSDLEREKIPFADNTFDVVVMLALLEHLDPKSVNRIFSEVFRVLAKGGVLVLTTPAFATSGLLKLMANLSLVSKIEIAEHKKSWQISEIVDFLVSSGFDKKKIESGYFQLGFNKWATARK